MRVSFPILSLLASLGLSSLALAVPTTAVQPRESRLSGGLFLEKVDYSAGDNSSPRTDNKLLFVGYKHMFNAQFGLGGGLGYLFDGSIGDSGRIDGGNGFRLALDGDFQIWQAGANRVIGTFGLNLDQFKYNENGVTVNMDMTDFTIGGLFRHTMGKFAVHGGLDIFLISNGKLKTSSQLGSYSTDLQRDSKLDIRLGATFAATSMADLRLDLLLFGQQTIILGFDLRV